jgi:hypothetical protein
MFLYRLTKAMRSKALQFGTIAKEAGLSEREQGHFVEGMKRGAEELPLSREVYLQLQLVLEREVLSALPRLAHPEENTVRPLAYATPAPLSPLRDPSHRRRVVAEEVFSRLLGVSVINDGILKQVAARNPQAANNFLFTVMKSWHLGGDLFSTTLGEIHIPRMTLNLESDAGPVRVAFFAEQQPSETEGKLVFGYAASVAYRKIVNLHVANIEQG